MDKVAFWSGEGMFVNEISRNEELYRNYVALAKEAVKYQKSLNANNVMTDDNVSIERKAMMMFIEALLEKWRYGDVSAIWKY